MREFGHEETTAMLLSAAVGMALLCGLVMAFPAFALFMRITFESFVPQTIAWEAKNAWAKCEGAIAGSVAWPPEPANACAAMQMCANEAPLSPRQNEVLLSAIRGLPNCGEP